MEILSGIPVLHCRFIKDTLIFYQQLLQFVLVNKRELDGELVWAHLMHAETTLMLQAIEADQQTSEPSISRHSSISLYFFVDNIADLHHLLKAKNYAVSAIKTRDYQMQEFSLHDPEGNKITLGEKA